MPTLTNNSPADEQLAVIMVFALVVSRAAEENQPQYGFGGEPYGKLPATNGASKMIGAVMFSVQAL